MRCPDGHESTATDWCDTCGVAMSGDPSSAAVAPAAGASVGGIEAAAGECPNCGTARIEGEAFCEVCGLDYATGRLPQAPTAAPVDPTPAAPAAAGEASGWNVVVGADRDWFDRNEAESGRVVEFPDQARPRTVDLSGDVMTIGRRDDGRGWFPDIDLGVPVLDPSTSRRHAELRRTDDGWVLVDVGSTNGTTLDGQKVTPQEEHPLAEGSVIHLGAFTRLVIHAPSETTS